MINLTFTLFLDIKKFLMNLIFFTLRSRDFIISELGAYSGGTNEISIIIVIEGGLLQV